jgi:hypothetical protein
MIPYRALLDPDVFWGNVLSCLGEDDTMYKFSERVSKIYGTTFNAINSSYKKASMPLFSTAIAVAATLGVSLDRLIGLDNTMPITDAQKMTEYRNISSTMDNLSEAFYRAYGVTIRYEILYKTDPQVMRIITSFPNKSVFDTHTPLRITCKGYSRPCNLYPYYRDSRDTQLYVCDARSIEHNYLSIGGNIYPEDIRDAYHTCYLGQNNDGVLESLYDYVNDFIKNRRDTYTYRQIASHINAYRRERHLIGTIGALSTNSFYWLNYLLGKMTKEHNS